MITIYQMNYLINDKEKTYYELLKKFSSVLR